MTKKVANGCRRIVTSPGCEFVSQDSSNRGRAAAGAVDNVVPFRGLCVVWSCYIIHGHFT